MRRHHHMGLYPVVAGRDHPDSGLPARAQGLGDRGQRVSGVEHPGTHQVRSHVLVAEAEPGGLGAVGGELLLHRPGLADAAPAPFRVRAGAQRVHDAVQIRADPQTVQGDIISDVDDGGDLPTVPGRPSPDTDQKPSPADTAGQHDYAHALHPDGRSGRRPRRDATTLWLVTPPRGSYPDVSSPVTEPLRELSVLGLLAGNAVFLFLGFSDLFIVIDRWASDFGLRCAQVFSTFVGPISLGLPVVALAQSPGRTTPADPASPASWREGRRPTAPPSASPRPENSLESGPRPGFSCPRPMSTFRQPNCGRRVPRGNPRLESVTVSRLSS